MAKIDNANKSRRRGLSALSISISAILAAGALAGSAVSVWHISQNYQESAEFSKSVNGRLEVDPMAFEQDKTDEQKAKENMQEAAKRLSSWLRDNGQEMFDVSYELYKKDKLEQPWQGFLNAKFNLDKIDSHWITSKDDKDKKVDNDSYLSFFDYEGFNSNNKTLLYRWYIPENDPQGSTPMFTMIDLESVMTVPKEMDQPDCQTKVISNDDGKWGIVYQVKNDDNRKLLNAIYNDMLEAYLFTQEDDPESSNTKTLADWKQPRLYIINDIEGLINEANYYLLNYRTRNDHIVRYREVYNETEYETFVKDYFEGEDDQGNPAGEGARSTANCLLSGGYYDFATDTEKYGVPNLNIFRWLDFEPGTKKYSIFSSHIEDILTIKDQNWKNFFPEKITDTFKNEVAENIEELDKTNLQYFWHEYLNKDEARKYLSNLIKYHLPVKFVDVKFDDPSGQAKEKFQKFQTSCLSVDIQPKFVDSIFGGDALVGWLSLGFLIYLIALAIILMVLYRLSGMLGWISLIFMLSMSMLIASISSTMISMSFLFGLFTLSLLGFMAVLAICGRIKRRLDSNDDTRVMIKKGFRKSLMPIVDASIVTLAFGICFTYIAPISLNKLGLVLIIGGFLIFLIMYLLNAGMHLLLFNNAITENNFKLFGKAPSNDANTALSQGNHLVPSSIDATKLEFDYYSSMSKKDIKLFDKKTFILLMVLVGLMVVGLVLFGVFGFATNSLFHSSGCIAIYYENGSIFEYKPFIDSGLTWTRFTHNEGSPWWYFYTDGINQAAIDYLVDGDYFTLGDTICVQTIYGSTNQDALTYALVSIIVGATIVSIYGAIRFNWASFVPILLGTIIIPILMIAISAICQVKFDHTVVLGFILISIINNMLTINIMGTIQDAWSRRDAYNKNELRFIIVTALKNNWTYLWALGLAYLIFLFCFGLTAPFGCEYIIILVAIGAVISLFVTPFSVAYLELYFLLIRNNILGQRAIKAQSKVIVNLDEIDEQSIEGINQFTKKKAIPKIEKVVDGK